jgi:hypothetical protein
VRRADEQENFVKSFKRLLPGAMAGAVLALAACGAGSTGNAGASAAASPGTPTTAQIAATVRSATSVRVRIVASPVSNGTPESADLGLFANGNMSGTLSLDRSKPPVTIIEVSKVAYVLLTPAFLKNAAGSSAACNGQCGKYIKVTGAEAASLVKDESLNKFAALFSDLRGEKRIGVTTVNGEQAIVLKYSGNMIVDVVASGPPYPLKISGNAGAGSSGLFEFSEWNSVPALTPPSASDLVDPAKLSQ